MEIANSTPLVAGYYVWPVRPPRWSMITLVKATFDLRDGVLQLADEQQPLSGDRRWDDDPFQSIAYDTDFAPVKPSGEMWLTGTLRTPGDRPVTQLFCGAQVGSLAFSFAAVGRRYWKKGLFGGVTDPEPFTDVQLRWENCFGAPEMLVNPVGRGIHAAPGGSKIQLPAIENPNQLLAHSKDAPPSHGGFPVDRLWPRRANKAGTYGAAYRASRWPWLAEDLDPTYFQAAPRHLRLSRTFWRGDEEVELTNLLADQPRVTAKLPGLSPKVFLDADGQLTKVALSLDTVVLDVDAAQLVAIWRGAVHDVEEDLRGIERMFVSGEYLAAPRDEGAYRLDLQELLAAREDADEPPEPAPEPAQADEPGPPDAAEDAGEMGDETLLSDPDFKRVLAQAQMRASMLADGVDPALVDGLMPAEVPGAVEAPPMPSPEQHAADLRAAERAAAELGLPPIETPPPSVDFDDATEVRGPAEGALSLRSKVEDAIAERRSLSQAYLRGADLRGLKLDRMDLRGADLTGAQLDATFFLEADLREAVLDEASAHEANFRGARLVGSSLDGLHGGGVCFDRAELSDAQGERVSLPGASFRAARLERAELPGATLSGACFEEAVLTEADLSGADVSGAMFRGAVLHELRLCDGANATGACFDDCDASKLRASGALLEDASFLMAKLSGARFSEARMARARLVGARADDADFDGALLHHADLRGCSARRARFMGASLVEARGQNADFLDACFERADLRAASMAGANFYGAQLWRAELSDADFAGALMSTAS